MEGESRFGPHLHPHNLGWKIVEGKLMSVQCEMAIESSAM